jgi:steroid delta-isomerase
MSTSDDIRNLITGYIRAFNARDFDHVMALYADDATLEDPVGTAMRRGTDEIRAFYEQYRHEPSFLQLTGDFRFPENAVAFSFYCYMGLTSDPMIIEVTDTFRFDEHGLIKEMRAFWGTANIHGISSRAPRPGLQHPLAGQVILVVGAGPVAREIAGALSDSGATVVAAATAGDADAIARSVIEAGGRAQALPLDQTDSSQPGSAAIKAVEIGGRLDACINVYLPDDAEAVLSCRQGQAEVLAEHGSSTRMISLVASPPEADMVRLPATVMHHWVIAPDHIAPQTLARTVSWLCLPLSGAMSGAIVDMF